MSIKIQHLMRPYCLKSIHHLYISKSYVLHRSIFKVMITNSFPLDGILFLGSYILVLRMNPYLNPGGLVPSALKRHFWRPLKMKQYLPSWHLVNVIAQIACIIPSAYEDVLQLINFMLILNLYMKLGSLFATPNLIQKGEVLEQHLMTLSITLVLLNISHLMAYNPKLVKIWISTGICVGIGLIKMSLHRANPMKILLKVP